MVSANKLSEADRARISAAIAEAEKSTSGEIYVVVTYAPHGDALVPVLVAALLAILLPWPLLYFTGLPIPAVLSIQAAAFVLAATILVLTRLPSGPLALRLADDAVRGQARTVFLAHGVHLTEERTGVLIYLALADHRVEIVADRTIHARVHQVVWDEIAAKVAAAAREGRIADGLVKAVDQAGAVLAAHFPPRPLDRNELPDRVVEI
jgi:putative membrane protein